MCASRHAGGSKKRETAKRNPKPRPTSSRFAKFFFFALPYFSVCKFFLSPSLPPDPSLDPHPLHTPPGMANIADVSSVAFRWLLSHVTNLQREKEKEKCFNVMQWSNDFQKVMYQHSYKQEFALYVNLQVNVTLHIFFFFVVLFTLSYMINMMLV